MIMVGQRYRDWQGASVSRDNQETLSLNSYPEWRQSLVKFARKPAPGTEYPGWYNGIPMTTLSLTSGCPHIPRPGFSPA